MTDYREPKRRREVFLDFYDFHIKHKAHPGAVYYMFPYIFDMYKMNMEQKLWFVFLNGVSQNVVSTWLLWKEFRDLDKLDLDKFSKYFRDSYKKFGWDVDRRYVKNKLEQCIESYIYNIGDNTQEGYFNAICNTKDPYANFGSIWEVIMSDFAYFGRLATFSYTEYLRIAGLNIDCDKLFLHDINGSKSHRNGLCKVLGRDNLDWTKQNDVEYSKELINWLEVEADKLLQDAKDKIKDKDVCYFTLESTLCCYKSWHRKNRRYPNVYNDMFYDRIKRAERLWGEQDYSLFWEARKKYLPEYLRLEDNPLDKGLHKDKQNHYRKTGQVIMMEEYGYKSEKTWLRNCILIIGECGVGKTWVMKQLLKDKQAKRIKLGMYMFHETDEYIVVGKYDNSTFEGSDKLSMAVMRDIGYMLGYMKKANKIAIFEGDRFTNSKFIDKAQPLIIRINGDGNKGRVERGSQQSERQVKTIKTRVNNIVANHYVNDSLMAFNLIMKIYENIKNK